ncbi:hypothetical protein SLA2020_418290 [Shorea laevis]
MLLSHFFKHLPCISCRRFSALSRRCIHPPGPLFHPLNFFFTNCNPVHQPPLPSSVLAKFFVPSCSYTSLTEPESSTAPTYLSVRIRCRRDVADSLSDALLEFGASSTSMDEDDNAKGADEICIDSIFPECEDVDASISQAADSIGLKEIPSYEVKMGEQYDWIKKTQESFDPVEVTEGLWIVPEWKTPPVDQAANIILNPGLAFGTGEHATTKLCLLLLRRLIKGGELFLDYGTGSGILAIAALKFGASLSVGIDINPLAITSARHNAALNDIGPEKMQLHLVSTKTFPDSTNEQKAMEEQTSCGSGIIWESEKYDVVIANILLNPLMELADHIVSFAKPGAAIGLSGILYEQLPDILDRYSPFLDGISVDEMDDWACVSGKRKRIPTGI